MRRNRLSELAGLLARPRWALAYWRGGRGLRARGSAPGARAGGFSLAAHPEALRDEPGALAAVCGANRAECERVLAAAWSPERVGGDEIAWWSREVLLRLSAALVELLRPRTVIEVGVELGYSSAAILRALAAQGPEGRLHSIDLPSLDLDAGQVGQVIPTELRGRWQLALGPSREELPRLLEGLEAVDLFIHDGDHSYASQYEDLEAVWPRLGPGGVAVVDDVWSPAIFDFAERRAAEVVAVQRADEQDGVGLLQKPR